MKIFVSKAKQSDIAEITALWAGFMELLRCTNPHYWKVKEGRDAFSSYLANAREDDEVLVAVAKEKEAGLVGFSLVQIEVLPEWFGSEKIGLLRYQAVDEKFQGMGAGRAMTAFVIEWLRALGIGRMELYVLKGLASSEYWSRMGFETFMDRKFIAF